jgi:hypothetical protein
MMKVRKKNRGLVQFVPTKKKTQNKVNFHYFLFLHLPMVDGLFG